jgi:hypothetical protein
LDSIGTVKYLAKYGGLGLQELGFASEGASCQSAITLVIRKKID